MGNYSKWIFIFISAFAFTKNVWADEVDDKYYNIITGPLENQLSAGPLVTVKITDVKDCAEKLQQIRTSELSALKINPIQDLVTHLQTRHDIEVAGVMAQWAAKSAAEIEKSQQPNKEASVEGRLKVFQIQKEKLKELSSEINRSSTMAKLRASNTPIKNSQEFSNEILNLVSLSDKEKSRFDSSLAKIRTLSTEGLTESLANIAALQGSPSKKWLEQQDSEQRSLFTSDLYIFGNGKGNFPAGVCSFLLKNPEDKKILEHKMSLLQTALQSDPKSKAGSPVEPGTDEDGVR